MDTLFVASHQNFFFVGITSLVHIFLGAVAFFWVSLVAPWDKTSVVVGVMLWGLVLVSFIGRGLAAFVAAIVMLFIVLIVLYQRSQRFPSLIHFPTARIMAIPVLYMIGHLLNGPNIPLTLWPIDAVIVIIFFVISLKPWVYFEGKVVGMALFLFARLHSEIPIRCLFIIPDLTTGILVFGKIVSEILRLTRRTRVVAIWFSACGRFLLELCFQLCSPSRYL